MDRNLRRRAPHRRAARPADAPCQHPRDERRQLSPQPKQGAKDQGRSLTPRGLAPKGQSALARASYMESARAKALIHSQRQIPTQKVADFCAATWLVFAPPLTLEPPAKIGPRP